MTSYELWDKRLKEFGADAMLLARNVSLVRRKSRLDVLYYGSMVVAFHQCGIVTLATQGYHTRSTLDVINTYSPAWVRLLQDKGVWYVAIDGAGRFPFVDPFNIDELTLTISPDTYKRMDDAWGRVDRNAAMDKTIGRYINGITAAMLWDLLHPEKKNSPFSSDCFVCAHVIPELAGDNHLRLHVEQKYYLASLFLNAYVATGKFQSPLARLFYDVDTGLVEQVKKHTRSFLRAQLLEREEVQL